MEKRSVKLRAGSKDGGRNSGPSPTGGADAVGRAESLRDPAWEDGLCPAERSGAVLPCPPPMPLLLAVIRAFGSVFPAGTPGIIEMRKVEISGSSWRFLSVSFFLMLFVWVISETYHSRKRDINSLCEAMAAIRSMCLPLPQSASWPSDPAPRRALLWSPVSARPSYRLLQPAGAGGASAFSCKAWFVFWFYI